jgi:hypothetical protein
MIGNQHALNYMLSPFSHMTRADNEVDGEITPRYCCGKYLSAKGAPDMFTTSSNIAISIMLPVGPSRIFRM